MNLLVIHDAEPGDGAGWPWAAPGRVSVRHLRSADLAARIAEADCIAVAVSCGLQAEHWTAVEQLLRRHTVPMLAFEPVAATQLAALRLGSTCTATLDRHGSVELHCRGQHSAFQRIVMARDSNPDLPHDGSRTTRFVFQGK